MVRIPAEPYRNRVAEAYECARWWEPHDELLFPCYSLFGIWLPAFDIAKKSNLYCSLKIPQMDSSFPVDLSLF
jgi:hypothetical protein